ncbi:MAG: MFS transporter [Alphaproteobacteria bacterium]|nr:MFS transporter [Alphaproteobacteria bacterium]
MSRPASLLTTGFAGVAHSFSHLFTLLYATVVLVLEREWGLSYGELIALSLPGMVMFGLGALPAGWLGDRWSASGMIAVFYFGVGLSSIATGLATGPLSIAIGLALIGTFASIYHPVGIPWLVRHALNRGRALGINGVFGSAGTAAAGIVAGTLAAWLGWRAAFILPGVVSLLIGLGFLWAMRGGFIVEGGQDAAPEPAPARADIKRTFIVLSFTMLLTGLIYQCTAFALPKLFDERLSGIGLDVAAIGGLVTLCYTVSALSQVAGGELADRFSLKGVYIWAQLLQIPVIAFAFTLYSPALVGAAALMISLNLAGQPAENALLARYTPPAWRGRAFGAKFVLALGIGSLGPVIIALLYEVTGALDVLFAALLLFAAGTAIVALWLPGRREAAIAGTSPATAAE